MIFLVTNFPGCLLAPGGRGGGGGGQARSKKRHSFHMGNIYSCGSVAEWLACWTEAQLRMRSNRSRDAVG